MRVSGEKHIYDSSEVRESMDSTPPTKLNGHSPSPTMGASMGNEREYRARAVELWDLAQRASDPELAAVYTQLAFQYERLADWTEHRHDLPEPWQPSPG